ncbi:hypothetical protein KIPB_005637 [Kipferlia bialata]|uniref:SET domain-containing protein n=1 Tax=Kipferlia bialata TaxID=797122 RepID=A0A9K3CVQ2_9EUKA|nr:hypothetical protein KIPB_005637 [Kipferlia bialata]|eukprot:g5637.t1
MCDAYEDCVGKDPFSNRTANGKTLSGIVRTNNYCGDQDMALFEFGAYLNHSCVYNVNCLWVEGGEGEEPMERYSAARDIKAGEELTRYYGRDMFTARDDRMDELRKLFNFDCTCEACSLTGYALLESDSNRRRLSEIVMGPLLRGRKPSMAELLESLRLTVYEFKSNPHMMGNIFQMGFLSATRSGNVALARKFAYNCMVAYSFVPDCHVDTIKEIQQCIKAHSKSRAKKNRKAGQAILPWDASKDGAWASLAKEMGVEAVWGFSHLPKECERDRRERLRQEAEAKKEEAAARNKAKMLEKRRLKLQKKKESAARKGKK